MFNSYDVIQLSFESDLRGLKNARLVEFCTLQTFGGSKKGLEDKILVPKPSTEIMQGVQSVEPRLMARIVKDVLFYERNLRKICLHIMWKMNLSKTFKILPNHPMTIPTLLMLLKSHSLVIRTPVKIPHQVLLHLTLLHECGDSLDGIFCRQCTCKSCGKGAHYGYNCPPKVPIISNPEPCKNQTIGKHLQNLQSLQQQCLFRTCQQCGCNEYDGVCFYCKVGNGTQINVSIPYSSNDSPSVANHPPQSQYVPYSRELCGNDSHYGYDCPPQVPFVYNQDLCFNQNFDYFPQTSPSFPQQYPCCENCGGPHETFQCQPMNEDYYHEQNSCYDSNSFGFDQFQPPQYTVNHPIFIQNELLNSQNKLMEQMTTLRDLVGQAIQKKEEEKRIAEEQAAKDRSWKIPICYDDDEDDTITYTSFTTQGTDNSLNRQLKRCWEIVDPEVGRIDDDILLTIKDDILREKLLNVNLLIAKIDSLRDNPTPSSEVVIKSTSTFPNLFLEETNTFDNSFPESETFRFNLEEISSGSPTTHSELSLPDYKAFYVDNDHFKERSSGSTTTHVDFSQYDSFIFDLSNDQFPPALHEFA
ncbi:hypothetical protein Tco_1004882 [Tanacetum coccineum]|uniref:CCHC-type domain-containing protein n=1 Tax=Tanacetum coccineum TaxID=301880 RepID=A0ABQ5FDV1_9ASTR